MRIYFAQDQQDPEDERAEWLRAAGYDVTVVPGHVELGIAMRESAPDLLLLDVLIAGKNGFEVAREIALKHPDREFPIVVSSRIYRGNPFREEAQRAGAQDYILLPVPERELLRRVKQAIARFDAPQRDLGNAA